MLLLNRFRESCSIHFDSHLISSPTTEVQPPHPSPLPTLLSSTLSNFPHISGLHLPLSVDLPFFGKTPVLFPFRPHLLFRPGVPPSPSGVPPLSSVCGPLSPAHFASKRQAVLRSSESALLATDRPTGLSACSCWDGSSDSCN